MTDSPVVEAPQALSAADVLTAWERWHGRHTIDRALGLLRLREPDGASDATRLPLGSRDASLLALRRDTFGDRIESWAKCESCGATAEVELSCSLLLEGMVDPPASWSVRRRGYDCTIRPLDSYDAAAAAVSIDIDEARAILIGRCVETAERSGRPILVERLPADVVAAIVDSLARNDPGAEVRIDIICPECGSTWVELFDVASAVVAEFEARARRLFRDVHVLARTYGWREPDILALSDSRRAAYVAMAGA